MDSVTPDYNNEPISKPIENEYNSNFYASTPAQNPQNYPPQDYNNQNFQPQAYNNNPNQPYSYSIKPQVYNNPNSTQPYSYCTNQPQNYPYNSIQPNSYQPNQAYRSSSTKTKNLPFLIMSIIQLVFVVVELIILIVKKLFPILLIHIDEVAILIISLLFFLSYLNKYEINSRLRCFFTGFVWFVGFAVRGMTMPMKHNDVLILIVLMIIRTFILFFSIPISNINSSPLNNKV